VQDRDVGKQFQVVGNCSLPVPFVSGWKQVCLLILPVQKSDGKLPL
jgi:hypothetical protein